VPVAMTALGVFSTDRPARPARPHAATVEELASHAALLQSIANPMWLAAD
jgi:DNA polymerase III subunit epsilon